VHSYEIVEYADKLADLISPYYVEGEKLENIKSGAHKALILSFSLKSSCYATMFLREVMRDGRDFNGLEEKEVEEELGDEAIE